MGELQRVAAAWEWFSLQPKRVAGVARFIRGKTIPDASHYVFEDQPATLRDYILHSLLISEPDMIVENNASRTPEFLNLKPLPKYATVEDAVRALKPRKIPTENYGEDAFMKLMLECVANVDCSSDEESEEVKMNRKYSTALANNDSQYFGMVG